jgi:hypothetical protein
MRLGVQLHRSAFHDSGTGTSPTLSGRWCELVVEAVRNGKILGRPTGEAMREHPGHKLRLLMDVGDVRVVRKRLTAG